jgi:hypothetical protein
MTAFQPVYADCDKRIKTIKEDISFHECKCLLTRLAGNQRAENEKSWNRLKNCENNLRLVKMEKMIYEAHEQQRTATLPLLFKKYSESVDLSLTLARKVATEEEYQQFCSGAKTQRDYIKIMCGVA